MHHLSWSIQRRNFSPSQNALTRGKAINHACIPAPCQYDLGEKQLHTTCQHYVSFIPNIYLFHSQVSHNYPSSIPNTRFYKTHLSKPITFCCLQVLGYTPMTECKWSFADTSLISHHADPFPQFFAFSSLALLCLYVVFQKNAILIFRNSLIFRVCVLYNVLIK